MEKKGKSFRSIEKLQTNQKKIIKVTVHYADLKSEKLLVMPVVSLQVIDSTTGSYIKKQNRQSAVTSFYENQRNDIDYIMPIMTQPCVVQDKKSQLLSWDECFVLNENLDHLLKKELCTVLFFEVIDLVPLSFTKYHYERLNENGMQKIAWAFLKISGPNNTVNTGSKMRLQLYKPNASQKKSKEIEVFQWWSAKSKKTLPASLYVSFEEVDAISVEPALRSMIPLQEEVGIGFYGYDNTALSESTPISTDASKSFSEKKSLVNQWSRKEGEPCKVPSRHFMSLESTGVCQILKFSSLGKTLVAGCGISDQSFLLIFDIPSGKLLQKHLAHAGMIYDVDWSEKDDYLLSASADYSVRLWNVKSGKSLTAFIHPSFVYSAKFQPGRNDISVTSCYDRVIRIWTYSKTTQLLQEIEAHNAAINSLCWNQQSMKLISADSAGEIKMWKCPKFRTNANKEFVKYVLDEELNLSEVQGLSINKVIYDPLSDTLIIFCADGITRLLDLKVEKFIATRNFPKCLTGCCSPCGNLLFLCDDYGSVTVCNRKTPELVSTLPNSYPSGLTSIDYHPREHALALSSSDESGSIHLYVYEDSEHYLQDNENNAHGKSTSKDRMEAPDLLKTSSRNKNLKNNKEEQQIISKPSKGHSSKNYMCDAETNQGEDFAKLALDTLDMKRYSSTSGSSINEKPKIYTRQSKSTESFSTVVPRSTQFDVSVIVDSHTESDTQGYANQIVQKSNLEVFDPVQKSSKRSQRRRKLKEKSQMSF